MRERMKAVGEDVTPFKPGDQVFAPGAGTGGALKPENLGFLEAAAVPVGARAALRYLRKAELRPGQEALVYGAS